MAVDVTFCGAVGTVTGSCYRVRHDHGVFLVDCGLFQGSKTVRELNYRRFPFDPHEPAALLLTHAHIDHSGLIPKLARHGFKGRVLATPGTADLLVPMLPDSGYIQEMEVERLNRRNQRRGQAEVTPIYTRRDAEAALKLVRAVEYQEWTEVMPGVRARFWDAGHMLGSASIEVEIAENGAPDPLRLLFSGDLGPGDKPFHPDPDGSLRPDYLFVEATYGDRERTDPTPAARQERLRAEVVDALAGGGLLLLPAFAVERTQELLYDLDVLFDSGALPAVEVFLDSPLAVTVTEVFDRNLPHVNQPGTPHPFHRHNLHPVIAAEDSRRLDRVHGHAIIMAASGMCDAGRIRHHLAANLWRPDATVLLAGYQAPGTLGHALLHGAPRVRIHGEEIEVRARIRSLDVYSGHADQRGLLAWIAGRQPVGQAIFLTHGEDTARATLRQALVAAGTPEALIRVPGLDETVALTRHGPVAQAAGPARLEGAALADGDWHNTYAETMLDLGHALRRLPSDAAREALLQDMRRLIGRAAAPPVAP